MHSGQPFPKQCVRLLFSSRTQCIDDLPPAHDFNIQRFDFVLPRQHPMQFRIRCMKRQAVPGKKITVAGHQHGPGRELRAQGQPGGKSSTTNAPCSQSASAGASPGHDRSRTASAASPRAAPARTVREPPRTSTTASLPGEHRSTWRMHPDCQRDRIQAARREYPALRSASS